MFGILEGKKTYIIAAVLAVAGFLHQIGKLPPDVYNWLLSLLGPVGLATLRAAK